MELETTRLYLREFRESDIPVLYRINRRPEVQRFDDDGPLVSENQFYQIIQGLIQEQAIIPRHSYYFAVLRREDGGLIGSSYIAIREAQHRQAEIGYVFDPDHWGQGYATEAAQALLAMGFETLHMHRVYAGVLQANKASVRVLEKLKMRCEATLRHDRWFQERWWDSHIYALLEDEWREAQP